MNPKTCCVTGHRKLDPSKIEPTKEALRNAVMQAIEDGYTHFISGFADGVDLYFAAIVAELKEKYNLYLEAALPYRNRINCKDSEFKRLLSQCNAVGVHSETSNRSCYLKRNRYMVNASDLLIAVYDGREKGGTTFTIKYAHIMRKELKVIHI